MRKLKNECSARYAVAALKIQKPKRTQKGMQNQSMMPSASGSGSYLVLLGSWQLGGYTRKLLQRHKLQGSWPQCGRNRGNAHSAPPRPVPPGPFGQAQSIKRVKRRNAPGTRRWGAEAVQAHKTNGVNLQCRLSPSTSLSLSLSFYTFFARVFSVCVCVCTFAVIACFAAQVSFSLGQRGGPKWLLATTLSLCVCVLECVRARFG